ncbi:Ribokinase-like protein [Mycotypha africana]|uniref:Ribokinase-like protein n=1 Tax=Mycotypha africana TaxID=64632 RepID=UPI0023016B0B|nr:Ribokinase-like protein [Mycotypha africana]KAI8979686.1 Ribokinase-like protein [Mycotypha africana]
MPYTFLAMENPLLDIQCKPSKDLLEKYKLKANDAILADASHESLYKEIVDNYEVAYVAGGAAQNTARGAQYLLPPNSTAYMGCASDDDFGKKMADAAKADGLYTNYQITQEAPTGICAVLITGNNRSLVTRLDAAEKFQTSFLQQPENWKLVEEAKYYYFGGFFITFDGGYQSALLVSQHAAENNKTFAFNLSAPFLSQFFKERLDAVIKNTDILFGNEDEARTYSKQAGWDTEDVQEIAKKLSKLEKGNAKPRIVVITQGADATVTAVGDEVKVFPVIKVDSSEIVDTNGAGDGFCGGFMGLYAQGVDDIGRCVKAAHYLANLVIKRVGPTYPPMSERTNIPSF